jgi:hypothetical protein
MNKRMGRPPKDPADWTDAFLAYYREKGNAHNACKAAQVSFHTYLKHRRAALAFDRACRLAYREYGAMLRQTLAELGIDKGNVIALLASLKAHSRRLAERYSEKAVDNRVLNVTVNEAPVSLAEADAKLQRMIAAASPATLALMAGQPAQAPAEVLEAELVPEETPGGVRPGPAGVRPGLAS